MVNKKLLPGLAGCILSTVVFISCQKDTSQANDSDSESTSAAIAVATSESSATGTVADTVYVMHQCGKGKHRDSIAESALSASITSYLSSNYSGYSFHKAFAVKDGSGVVSAYVVIIYFNDKPVALQFDSNGNFEKILEQREGSDLKGRGWHENGRFGCRDGKQRDTIAISALPSSIVSYISSNYSQDTLLRAYKNQHDSSIVVISSNSGLFATVFDSNNQFVKRISIPLAKGKLSSVEQAALPSNVLSYLSSTYPSYVFNKAFSVSINGSIQGYQVIIEANNTRYAVRFDASGSFVAVKTIW